VDVWNAKGLLTSQVTRILQGHASATIAYDPRFQGDLLITADSTTEEKEGQQDLEGLTRVIYPAKQELSVKLKMPQTTFRPGEDVSADLSVLTPEGHATESALGVLVFDKAVAERVRTDEDFGRDYGFSIYDYFEPLYGWTIGGVSYRDLLDLDASRPFPEGLDLVAEGMTHFGPAAWNPWMGDETLEGGPWDARFASSTFDKWLQKELGPMEFVLNEWNVTHHEFPGDEAGVRAALKAQNIDFDGLRDPWGEPFQMKYSYRRADRILSIVSNGVDKKAGSDDNFTVATFQWRYFYNTGAEIDRASREYLSRSGKYIRDYPTLRDEMKKRGIDIDSLRDPWGHAYAFSFDISGVNYQISVKSAGKDGIFNSEVKPSWDDVGEWTSSIRYFLNQDTALRTALVEQFEKDATFPQSEEQLKPILALAKLGADSLTDPWGHPYRFAFDMQSRYGNDVSYHDVRSYTESPTQTRKVTEVTPMTQQVAYLHVLTNGPENDPNRAFSVADYSRVIAEQTSKDKEPVPVKKQAPVAVGTGGIRGVVSDTTGAVIVGASVTATSEDTALSFPAEETDADGSYTLANLPPGMYDVVCTAKGFKTSSVTGVPVLNGSSTQVDITLNLGSVTETVEVTAASPQVNATSGEISSSQGISSTAGEKPLFTPRLRKYFPETLFWQPEVITDKQGHAHINFPMADNITTWKMSVLASTEAGQVGIAEKELRSFQPFFIELDPPKILTEGDKISLPVLLRNYTDQPQSVLTEMEPEPWSTILSDSKQRVTIAPNGDASPVFTFRADRSAKSAKERVTARNATTGDAVEHELAVHPDGQEISFSTSRVLGGAQNSIELEVPENAIRGSADAELRIYPNLTAHVLDVMRGLGTIPTGCAEQITSTAYVNLMALELLKSAGQENTEASNPRSAIVKQARKTLEGAYDQLIEMQNPDGGFTYWLGGKGKPSDVALTAYVLRFLNPAREFIEVDGTLLERARDYLVKEQAKSGAWTRYRWDHNDEEDDPNLTAYVARALASSIANPTGKDADKQRNAEASLKLALDFLEARIDSWSDPYLAGNYAIAAMESGHKEHVENAEWVLGRLAHREGDTTYWNLEANTTPFYGWGEEGRLETTGLAVEALAKLQAAHPDRDRAETISRGLEYLLTHKDRYAMWYSTQATQNVLEAMIAAMPPAAETSGDSEATVRVNGHEVQSIRLPNPQEVVGPVTIALGDTLEKGGNKIEIIRTGSAAAMNASVLTSYYIPWVESQATARESFKTGETRALRLKVQYDHNDPKLGDVVHCSVEVERIGFMGYGMMIAEVGLPPGAEVERASLEQEGVYSYEIQPNRVVFYLWPSAGGTKFGFDFRMRYRIEAMTAASVLYDYYNPEANATVAPVSFAVH
jgi:A-macroglobulin TED domain/Alpha-2-macroglobulin family/Carboxypeptidase regulatory-like domain/A-macroglobulin receptor binding domain